MLVGMEVKLRQGFGRLRVAKPAGPRGFEQLQRLCAKEVGKNRILGIVRDFPIGQSQVAFLIERR